MKELEYFSTRLPGELKHKVKIQAAMDKTKVQELVEKIIREWFEDQEKGGK